MIIFELKSKGGSLDSPLSLNDYLDKYGWNFSKKACMEAVSKMYKQNGDHIVFKTKAEVDDILQHHNIQLEHDHCYNAVYVYHMCLADFYGKSITTEEQLCKHIKCIIDDVDNPGGNVFRKWYADCESKGLILDWDDLI